MTRVIGQLAIQLAALADVVEHQHAARHVARAVANRRGAALDVQLVAVATDQQRRPHGLDRARAPDRDRQRILQRLAGFLVEAAEDLVDDATLRMLEAPAGQLLGDRIQIFDAALRVGGDDAVADRLQRDLRAFLFLEQRVFEQLALGHVEVDADDAARAALLVDARLGAADDPQPHAVAMSQAMHAFEQRLLAGEMIAQRRVHARADLPDAPAAASRSAARPRRRRSRASTSSAARNTWSCCSRSKSHRPSFAPCSASSLRSSSSLQVAAIAHALEAAWHSSSRAASASGADSRPSCRAAASSTAR